jgi:hypothetical protein
MNVLIVLVVGYQLLRRRDWLSGAGWATLALLASLGWLMPWYVIWLLPLARCARWSAEGSEHRRDSARG